MRPMHHVPEALLVAYAAGKSSEAEALLVATHLTLCPTCRSEVGDLELLGGELLAELPESEVSPSVFDATLAKLEEERSSPVEEKKPEFPSQSPLQLPRPILRYLENKSELRWQRVLPGIRAITLPILENGWPVELVELRPGLRIPNHTHGGQELTLVLTGGFVDSGDHFARGDLAVRDEHAKHEVLVDGGEACVSLIVRDAELIPLTWLGRAMKFLSGR